MNCNCIKNVQDKILEVQPIKGEKILTARLPVLMAFSPSGLNSRLAIQCELTLEGRKLPRKIDMAYAFCPFCGLPAGRDEDINEEVEP